MLVHPKHTNIKESSSVINKYNIYIYMNQIIEQLLYLQLESKILHWQTTSYAQHIAYGGFYDALDDFIDRLVEVYQGKYGTRLQFDKALQLKNIDNIDIDNALDKACMMLTDDFEKSLDSTRANSELENIRDEIKAEIDKLRYLLTLQ
jgi:hypothetical protein